MRLVRLPRGLEERRRSLQEGDADGVRTGLHRHANSQIAIHVVVVRLIVLGESGFARRRLHREQLHALAIEEQFQIGGVVQPLDVLVPIARQANLELVVAVHREGVADERAAARADRQPFDVVFLREVGRRPDRVAVGRYARTSHGDAADLLGRGDVAIEQRRREIADRHVVEAVARFVGGQERRDVDVERQQIADGVLVLRAGQAAQRRGASRIRRRGRGAIERRLERGDLGVVAGFVRPRRSGRRHLPRADFADNLLPHVRTLADVVRGRRVERQAAAFQALVVARRAIPRDEGGVRRCGRRRSAGRRLLRVERQQEPARQHEGRHAAAERSARRVDHIFVTARADAANDTTSL